MKGLKSQKIFYSKSDLIFARTLFLLCEKVPRLQYVSIPIRKIKSNLISNRINC